MPLSPRQTALSSADYLRSPEELAPSLPPHWLKFISFGGLAFLILILALTLFGPMDEYVLATGKIYPAHYDLIFSPTEGILKEKLVRAGDTVKKGDILARLDTWEAEKRIAAIEADLAQAEGEFQLAKASRQKIDAVPVPPEFLFSPVEAQRQGEIVNVQQDHLNRLERLQKSGASSPVELLNQRLQLITAESQLKRNQQARTLLDGPYGKAAQLEAAEREKVTAIRVENLQKQLALAREEAARCVILAPNDGLILSSTNRWPGETVPLGAPLFRIAQEGPQTLRLTASEDRIHRIHPGQIVRFRARSTIDQLERPTLATITTVSLDRDLPYEATPTESDAPYRIQAKITDSADFFPIGAGVDAEIILYSRPFWQLLFQKTQGTKTSGS